MCVCIYIYIYIHTRVCVCVCCTVTTNEKSIINIHQKRDTNITKYNPKDSHQIVIKLQENRRRKKTLQKQTYNSEQNDDKNMHIEVYLKCKWNTPTKSYRVIECIQT